MAAKTEEMMAKSRYQNNRFIYSFLSSLFSSIIFLFASVQTHKFRVPGIWIYPPAEFIISKVDRNDVWALRDWKGMKSIKSVGWRAPRLNKQLNAYYFRLIIFSLSCRSRTQCFFCTFFSRGPYRHTSATYIHFAHNTRCTHGRMGTCLQQHTTCRLLTPICLIFTLRQQVINTNIYWFIIDLVLPAHTWAIKWSETVWMCAAAIKRYIAHTQTLIRLHCVCRINVFALNQAAGEMRNTIFFRFYLLVCEYIDDWSRW